MCVYKYTIVLYDDHHDLSKSRIILHTSHIKCHEHPYGSSPTHDPVQTQECKEILHRCGRQGTFDQTKDRH